MMKLSRDQWPKFNAATWSPVFYASLPDVLLVVGACSLTYGAWLVYEPAGFITAGLLLMAGGFLASRKFA